MYNSFVSVPTKVSHYKSFDLYRIDKSGNSERCELFSNYCFYLASQGVAAGTYKRYTLAVASKLDYIEVGLSLNLAQGSVFSIYTSFDLYLMSGLSSDDALVKTMTSVLGERILSGVSRSVNAAAADSFIGFCAYECKRVKSRMENGLPYPDYGRDERILVGLATAEFDKQIRRAQDQLGRKIRKGTSRTSDHVNRFEDKSSTPIKPNKYFPLGKISRLIESAGSYRDSALWALCAATSMRISEALQVLWEDINFAEGTILCVCPEGRPNINVSYRGLTSEQVKCLKWKARETDQTVLLEPYGALFFKYLALYRVDGSSSQHNFIFETEEGRPLCLSDYGQVVLAPFKRAAAPIYEELNLSLVRVGLHSLRHSYCYFMYNFLTFENGHKLTLTDLAKLTGHKSLKTLEKYAHRDRELFLEEIHIAMSKWRGMSDKSELELRYEYLRERCLAVKNKLDIKREAA